ncbi:extracellular solute-binding protein [Paenibacillus solisilvae]|uniref:Extracellular solute-binding protein n=1 Tax=Paenibacillus solisilvae TaxID=2486751 RepID=A0ABW0VXY1_9BACL
MTRNRKLSGLIVSMAVFLLSACSNPASPSTSGTNDGSASTQNTQQSSDSAAQDTKQTTDPVAEQVKAGKFSPSIELTIGRSTHTGLTFDQGESYDKNSVYDAYEQNLGITLKNMWVVDPAQYDQKVQTSIASNTLPDLMEVNAVQLQQMVNAGEVMDMTDLINKYGSQETKDFFNGNISKKQMGTATFDGKIMAIPFTDSPYNFSWYFYIRKDWLDKLNLPEPKTMQDVENIAKAFVEKQPGGAGKTYGIALTKDLYSDAYGLIPFFNGYHAYPGQWIKDASGKMVYGSIQPEMKTALQHLQDMYNSGLIDPEFSIKDPDKENELVANNQLGIAFGKFWLTSWPLKQAVIKNGKADQVWGTYPLLSADDKPALVQIPLGINGYYAVSKNAKHPEAVIALVNKRVNDMIQQSKGDVPDSEKAFTESASGNGMYSFLQPIVFYNPEDRLNDGKLIPQAILRFFPRIKWPVTTMCSLI